MNKAQARKARLISQGELLNTPALPLDLPPADARPAPVANLASLREEQLARANAINIDFATLEAIFQGQLAFAIAHADRLSFWMEEHLPLLGSQDDPHWPAYWRVDARYRYADETVQLLRKRGHALVCPNHGLEGRPGLEDLSLRGLLSGEGLMAWTRYCERCVEHEIERVAKGLAAKHAAAQSPSSAKPDSWRGFEVKPLPADSQEATS